MSLFLRARFDEESFSIWVKISILDEEKRIASSFQEILFFVKKLPSGHTQRRVKRGRNDGMQRWWLLSQSQAYILGVFSLELIFFERDERVHTI